MELHATWISVRAAKIVGRCKSFRAVAVFNRVIDFESEEGLISIQRRGRALTPLSVVVDDDSFCMLSRVMRRKRKEEITIAISHEAPVDCGIDAAAGGPPPLWSKCLEKLIAILARDGSVAIAATEALWAKNRPDHAQSRAREIISKSERLLESGRYADAADVLNDLSGLGPGLTPAGDDFLVGVLAACKRWMNQPPSSFGAFLAGAVSKTGKGRTWLSSELLKCAAGGEFAQSIRDVVTAAHGPELTKAVARAASFGHTSGSDSLGGILWMAETALNLHQKSQKRRRKFYGN